MAKKRATLRPKKAGRRKKAGRPRTSITKRTISFRAPADVEAAFRQLADEESDQRMGARVPLSELYNRALGRYLAAQGIEVVGYNAARKATG